MGDLINNSKSILKVVKSRGFLDYLAIDKNITNNYKFSDYLNIFKIINKDKNIKKFNNFRNNDDFLDLVCNNYSDYTNVKLYYNEQKLLACFEFGEIYYNILININYFKNYPNFFNYVSELEDFIKTTYNS